MPKMTIRVILKSGSEFAIKCDKFTIQQNGFGQATGYNIEGITENKPVYLDFPSRTRLDAMRGRVAPSDYSKERR